MKTKFWPSPFWLILLTALTFVGCGIQSIPRSNNQVDAAWAEVLNQYQRRSDLIPNLVQTVKGYAAHESATFTAVVEARAKATAVHVAADKLNADSLRSFQAAQGELTSALSRLLVVAENYPQLKANENFRDLQAQLEGTENRITIARRRYIETVQQFNDLVTVLPTSLTNRLVFKHEKKPQFTIDDAAAKSQAPAVNFNP